MTLDAQLAIEAAARLIGNSDYKRVVEAVMQQLDNMLLNADTSNPQTLQLEAIRREAAYAIFDYIDQMANAKLVTTPSDKT